MKNNKKLSQLILLMLLLTGCNENLSYVNNLQSYVKTLNWRENFTICQLTDIHWNISTDMISSEKYIQKVINEVKKQYGQIDLIEITGDSFAGGNSNNVKRLVKFLENQNIPFATTWGNHDHNGIYSASWLSQTFLNAKNSLYTEVIDDDIHGRSNYVINIKENDIVKWQIANLDSGTNESPSGFIFSRPYDYIRDEQTEWWLAEHDLIGKDVPTIAYYHVPQYEMFDAYQRYTEDKSYGNYKYFKHDPISVSDIETRSFYDAGKENGLKAIFYGHDHSNDFTMTTEDGIVLGYGVKTGKELYYTTITQEEAQETGITELDKSFDLIGASVVTLKSDKTFTLSHLYLNEESDGSEFIRWIDYEN